MLNQSSLVRTSFKMEYKIFVWCVFSQFQPMLVFYFCLRFCKNNIQFTLAFFRCNLKSWKASKNSFFSCNIFNYFKVIICSSFIGKSFSGLVPFKECFDVWSSEEEGEVERSIKCVPFILHMTGFSKSSHWQM